MKRKIKDATGLVADAVILSARLYRELAVSAMRLIPGRS